MGEDEHFLAFLLELLKQLNQENGLATRLEEFVSKLLVGECSQFNLLLDLVGNQEGMVAALPQLHGQRVEVG